MKRILTICALAGAISLTALAQSDPSGKGNRPAPDAGKHSQQLESEKIAFITRQVDITPEEAGPFWAIYNKVEKEQKALVKKEMEAFRILNKTLREDGKDGAAPKTDTEIDALLSNYLLAKKANVDLHSKHFSEYKKIVGVKKTALFFAAQERFRRQQINKLRRHGQPSADNPSKNHPSGTAK